MRVLHIGKYFPPHRGGIESHLETLAKSLQQFVDLDLVVASEGRLTEKCVIDGLPITRAGTLFRFASAPVCPAMTRMMQESEADLIHLHLPNPAAVLFYLASRFKGPVIVSYHADTLRHRFLARAFQPFLLHVLDRSAAIVVSSDRYVETSPILNRYRERSRVIPYGISIEESAFVRPAEVQKIRHQYGERIILTVGRLVYYKGHRQLIRAMKKVRARLLIVGHGPLRKELETMVSECGVGDRVTLVGATENVLPYYHASDMFVLPSVCRTEAFGIVQLEAMACGKPVINTDLPTGVPGISLHAVTGLTVPPEDPEALAAAINLLLDKPELRFKYGQAARSRVEQEFTAEVMARRMLQLYNEVAGLPSARHRVASQARAQRCGSNE